MRFRHALALLMLLPSLCGAQALVNCSPGVPCSITGPSGTGTGDPAWLAFGKINSDLNYPALPSLPSVAGTESIPVSSAATAFRVSPNQLALYTYTVPAPNLTVTGTLTAGGIAVPTYPLSAAEMTAGVTPTNFSKPYFDVVRYGGDPTGVADSTNAGNNCIAVAAVTAGPGAECLWEPGTYTDATALVLKPGVMLRGYGATINYSGTLFAITTPATGATLKAGIQGMLINYTNSAAGALNLASTYGSVFRDIRITGASSTTNIVVALSTNSTGTPNPIGGYQNAFNTFDNILIDANVGTALQFLGTDSSHVVTDNIFIGFDLEGGPTGGANVYGIEFNQWCDSNSFAGFTELRLAQVSPASGIGVGFGTGAGGGAYAESFQLLAVDVFGAPGTDNRQGIIANNTPVKFVTVDLFEYGPTQGLGGLPNVGQLLSGAINQAPRTATNYQSMQYIGTNLSVGPVVDTSVVVKAQNFGQATGATQYDFLAQTAGFNSGAPALVAGYGSVPSLTASGSLYTVAQVMGYRALTAAAGANATATNVYGYYADDQTIGATANYGFYSNVSSGASKFAFFGGGTAASSLGGALTVTGGIVSGAPTGGNLGNGTINATGISINNVAVSTATGANPSATVGTAAVNGVASTFMRSDGAPAINLTMTPAWTGAHTWAPASGVPITLTAAAATNALVINQAAAASAIVVPSPAASPAQIALRGNGNAGAAAFLVSQDGTGVANLNQAANAALKISANGNTVLTANATGTATFGSAVISGGTVFAIASGTGACATSSTLVGGSHAGHFTCTGTTGASTVTLTLPAVTNAYSCYGRDITTPTTVTQTGALSTTSVTLTLTSVTANDVVQFGCPTAY